MIPRGRVFVRGMPKGFNKMLWLWNSGERDFDVILHKTYAHYRALANKRDVHGKKRVGQLLSRKNEARKALKALKRYVGQSRTISPKDAAGRRKVV